MNYSRFRRFVLGSLSLVALLYACSTPQQSGQSKPDKTTVGIDKEVHFLTSEGEDVIVFPGAYAVKTEKDGLRLIGDEGTASESLVIEAQSMNHKESVSSPTALSFSEKEDEHMVMLLLPGGTGWEAQGSYSGVQKRALRNPALRKAQARRQFLIRNKLKFKPAPFALSALSVRYAKLNKTFTGRKSQTTWRLPVSDTLATGKYTLVWSAKSQNPTEARLIKTLVQKKQCCVSLKVGATTLQWPPPKPRRGTPIRKTFTVTYDRRGNLVTSANLTNSRSKNWPKYATLAIKSGKKEWKSTATKIYATAVSYYTSELHPIFSHDRCTTCHSIGDRAAIVAMHEQRLGAGNYPDNDQVQPHNPDFCGSCHNIPPNSGHTDVDLNNEWFSPASVQGINWKGWNAGRTCAKVTGPFTNKDGVTGAPFDAQTFHHHFHDDPRIIWAVISGWVPFGRDDLPVPMKNNRQGWFNKVDPWVNAGTPCPKWGFFQRQGKLQFSRPAPRR